MTSDPRAMDVRLQGNPQLHYGINGGAGRNSRPGEDDALKSLSQEEQECLQFFEKTIDSLEESLEENDRRRIPASSGRPARAVNSRPQTSHPLVSSLLARHPSSKDQDIIYLVRPEPDLVQTKEPIFNPASPDFQSMMQSPESHFEIKPRRDLKDSLPSEYNPPLPSGSYGATDSPSSYHPPGCIPTPVLIAQQIAENQAGGTSRFNPLSFRSISQESDQSPSPSSDSPSKHGPPTSAKPSRFPANINMIHGNKDYQNPPRANVNIQERRNQMLANLTGTSNPLLQEDYQPAVEETARNTPIRSISFKDPSPAQSRLEALSKLGLNRGRAMSAGVSLLPIPNSISLDPQTVAETSAKPLEASAPPKTEIRAKPLEANSPSTTVPSTKPLEASAPPTIEISAKPLVASAPRTTVTSTKPLEASAPPKTEIRANPLEANSPRTTVTSTKPLEASAPPKTVTSTKPLEASASPKTVTSTKHLEASAPPTIETIAKPLVASASPKTETRAKPLEASAPPKTETSTKPLKASASPKTETRAKLPEANVTTPSQSPIQVDRKPEFLQTESSRRHEDRHRQPSPSPPAVTRSRNYPPPYEDRASFTPPPEVTSLESNSYGGKSIVVNPSVSSKSEPVAPASHESKILPTALASPTEFNTYGGKTKVMNPASVAVTRGHLPDILSSHIDKSQTLPAKPEPLPTELNSYGGKSRTFNPSSSGINRPSVSPAKSVKAPVPAPAPKPRHSYHGATQKPAAQALSPEHRRRSSSMFRPQGITVQFSGRGATDESRREALRKLGLLKES